jgi:GT2 family glycosyltransferase
MVREYVPSPVGGLSELVTISINNYNGQAVLPATLSAIEALYGKSMAVQLVDDGSTDGSVQWVREAYPWVRVFAMPGNTKRLNKLRNRGLKEAKTPYVLMLDNDITLLAGCVETLVKVMMEEADVLCCTPRLMYHDDEGKLYSDGAGLHYLCVSTPSARGQRVADRAVSAPRPTIGGGIMLIDREAAGRVGNFDEQFLIGWGDDGEFQLRGRIAGYQVLHVAGGRCLHVEREHSRARVLGQLYNRYRLMYLTYATRTLVLLGPALLFFEVMLTLMSVFKGFAGDRFGSVKMFMADRPQLRDARRRIQAGRRVGDGVILEAGPLGTTGRVGRSRLLVWAAGLWGGFFDVYWKLVRGGLSRQCKKPVGNADMDGMQACVASGRGVGDRRG